MAEKKKTSSVKDEEKEVNNDTVIKYSPNDDVKYPVDKLRLDCIHLFGVTKSTFDGAFFDAKNEEYTLDEARSKINEWLYGKGGTK